jgi:hypothetical protein
VYTSALRKVRMAFLNINQENEKFWTRRSG